jgi:hypothetical protein
MRASQDLDSVKRGVVASDDVHYPLINENIELKGTITQLKEQLIKRGHTVEDLSSDIMLIRNDLKYLHQKLNRG